jgi:hypothetical protein
MVNALEFARTISQLPYFGYTLEVLLRTAMEGKIDEFIVQVVNLLDHFPQALTVPISYARKTEEGEWTRLFQAVGEPKDLFDVSWSFLVENNILTCHCPNSVAWPESLQTCPLHHSTC